jgi:glycosyltransferase involved in cell wall biosynthesis
MGGAEQSLMELLRHLDRRRFEPFFVASEEGQVSAEARELGIPVLFCPLPAKVSAVSRTALGFGSLARMPGHLPGYLMRLAATVRSVRPHLSYSNSLKDHVASALLAPAVRRPVVWHFRDTIERKVVRDFVESLALASPVHLIANSHFTAGQFPRLSRRQGKTTVVYNGLDLDLIDRERRAGPVGEVPASSGMVVGIVGALCPEKGQSLLIRALGLLAGKIPDISCWIVGEEMYSTARHEKGYRGVLENLARTLGVRDRVHFLGWRKDVLSLVERMDVLVCASDPSLCVESFGRTVVEAMACGKPVVSVAAGGPRETVADGVTGTLFKTYSPEAMADAILRLADDPEHMRRMGQAGRRRVEELFTSRKYVEGVENCLARILQR